MKKLLLINIFLIVCCISLTKIAYAAAPALSNLTLSQGTLSPAFSSNTSDYRVSVDNSIQAISITPTAADSGSTIKVNGAGATSGAASSAIPLVVGHNTITIQVTSASGSQRIYTVTVQRAAAPSLVLTSSATSIPENSPLTLTAKLTGGLNPSGTITFKDSSTILGTAPLTSDTATFSTAALSKGSHLITAYYSGDTNNLAVTSAALTINVGTRSNPSQNAAVQAIVSSQAAAVKRFAKTQVANVVNRLEQLHNDSAPVLPPKDTMPSAKTALPTAAIRHIERFTLDPMSSSLIPCEDDVFSEDSSNSNTNRLYQLVNQSMQKIVNQNILLTKSGNNQPIHVWSYGAVSWGKLTANDGADNRFTTSGYSMGIDKQMNPRLTAGLALGYGLDHSKFDVANGSSDGNAKTATLYASWKLTPMTYLDLLGGYGKLTFDNKRWSKDSDSTLYGNRQGHNIFGAIGISTAYQANNLNFSNYGRVEVTKSTLDSYTEQGSNVWALAYDKLNTTTVDGVWGLLINRTIPKNWGTLSPGLRLEYRHSFSGGFTQRLGYADLGDMSYAVTGNSATGNAITLGLSLAATMKRNVDYKLEYLFTDNCGSGYSQQIQATAKIQI